jgi:hypothetical protein
VISTVAGSRTLDAGELLGVAGDHLVVADDVLHVGLAPAVDLGQSCQAREKATSSATISRPLWNLTPCRSGIV